MQLDALVAEDEPLLRQALVAQLRRLWPELRIVAECEDGAAALEMLETLRPDLAFLDIRMPGVTGIDVARALETLSPRTQVVFITASFGLGETVVQGAVNPDEFYVHKPTLALGKPAIIRRNLGSKLIKMIFTDKAVAGKSVRTVDVPEADRNRFSLSDEDVLELARYAVALANAQGGVLRVGAEYGADTAELRKMRHPRRTAMRQDAFRKASALRLHRRLHRSESTGKRMHQSERIPRQSLRRPARQSPWRKGQRPSLRGRSRPQPAG